jgi:hypothetical protein
MLTEAEQTEQNNIMALAHMFASIAVTNRGKTPESTKKHHCHYKHCMATNAITNPPSQAVYIVFPVFHPFAAAFVELQLTPGRPTAQAVAVRAAEMLLAVAELTSAAHGLPVTSGLTSEKTAHVLRPSCSAGIATSSVPVRLKAR